MVQQLEFFDISSPCVGVCQVDNRGFCLGCMRSREERVQWLAMTNSQKKEVLKRCRQRYLRRRKINNKEIEIAQFHEQQQHNLF